MDLEKKRWQFGIEVPYLKLESKYNIKGNILLLPVVGTGDSIIHLSKLVGIYFYFKFVHQIRSSISQ